MIQLGHKLVELLRAEGIFGDLWAKDHRVVRGAANPADYISTGLITEKLEASLLRWPYFSVLRDGQVPQVGTFTRTRNVIGHPRDGFADLAKIRRLMDAGATLKLNQLSDWHRPTREIVRAIEETAPVSVSTYVFWTPEEKRGMLPHRDASHVVVVQLEGRKEWHLYAQRGQVRSDAGLDVDNAEPSHRFVLEPGDVLYLPHGWPHDAVAHGGPSMHLTFTLTEPTPEDLLEALRQHIEDANPDLVGRFHARTLEQRSSDVQAALVRGLDELDAETWTRLALSTMRRKTG